MTLRLNKKVLLPLTFLTLSSASIYATNQSFVASINGWSEPTIVEGTALHFGKIRLVNGSTCTMDAAGAVTGDCDASDSNIARGAITVSGLAPSSAMNITVTGSNGSNLTFAPATKATDGTTTVNTTDGVAQAFTTDASATDIAIDVYGAMTVTSPLTAGGTYTVNYTVDVAFQ